MRGTQVQVLTKERGCAPIMPRADAIEARDHSSKLRNGGRDRGPDRGGIMRNIAGWRRVGRTEAGPTAKHALKTPAAPSLGDAPRHLCLGPVPPPPGAGRASAC